MGWGVVALDVGGIEAYAANSVHIEGRKGFPLALVISSNCTVPGAVFENVVARRDALF